MLCSHATGVGKRMDGFMKKNILLILFVLFTSAMLSAEINKKNIIGKQNRFFISVIGETRDSALFIEFKDENKYTFFSPYGGYLWSSSDYIVNGDTISFSVLKEENPFNIEELNKLFSASNKNQHVDFTYDKDFYTFYLRGGFKNGNVGLFPQKSESTPDGTICTIGNVEVIKKTGYLVPIENLIVRKEPYVKAETGSIDYEFEIFRLTENDYRGTEKFNKDYAINNNLPANNRISPVLLAGMIKKYSAVTVEKQTIDGITAPWYRISFTDSDGGEWYYWVFGGYIKEIDNPATKEYEHLFFKVAVKKEYLIPLEKIKNEKQKLVNQSKTVLEFAEPLYKLSTKIEFNHDHTGEKKGYYTMYYYNNNCTYSTVVELVNNDLISSSKLKIGMNKQSVIELLGQPVKSSANTIEYNTFEYTQGYGYELSFTIENNCVSKIKIYFEK